MSKGQSKRLSSENWPCIAIGTMTAVCIAIVGDYVTAALETSITREPQDVSSAVMTLVQTALGGVIGLIGAYFGANE